jgi:fengycin family lipopeptide synthetase B
MIEPMTIDLLIATLRERGIRIWLDGKNLAYRSPVGALTPELLAQLSQQKAAVIEFLQNARNGAAEQPLLRPRSVPNNLPLSLAQERLWFLDQLEPDSPVYNIPFSFPLKGHLDVNALQSSLNEIVRRHEVLRTRFELVGGESRQIISPAGSVEMPLVDLSGFPEQERKAEANRLCVEEARLPFSLAKGPLLRARLFFLGADEYILLIVIHHIVSDGWSFGVLVSELNALYGAFVAGQSPSLPELPIQYADYALWQREWLQGAVLEQQIDYWKRQLAGAPLVLDLPTDYPRATTQSHRGAVLTYQVSKDVLPALNELSRNAKASLFMTLLAAFQTLLYRFTGQEDILVGSVIAGRNRAEVENLIGFFVNTLTLRGNLSGDPTFLTLLGRTRQVALDAYAHQELPFEKLVEVLQPERDTSRSPLFQVLFALQNQPIETLKLKGLEPSQLTIVDNGTAKFDLSLHVRENGQALTLFFHYSTDLFEEQTIRRLAGYYEALLVEIVANPNCRVSEVPLLTTAERQQLLMGWNRTDTAYSQDRCLHELIEAQVERTPEATAVVYENDRLTYRELNRRANQLAHHLRKLGVGSDTLVGVCVERSLEMVVGLLGILKAGGAYVPVEPIWPAERIAYVLRDAQVPVLLTRKSLCDQLKLGISHLKVLCLDEEFDPENLAGDENPNAGARPENQAYIIYTSGSTGNPKGVMVTHRNVVRLFDATQSWFQFNAQDVWTMFHSYAFDFSVWEIWGALFYGGRLVIVPYLVSRSPEAFLELLARERVTVLNQTPSAFRQLIQIEPYAGQPVKLALRYVIFGGEALEMQSLRPWFDRHGDQQPQLINMYGITETTVHVTYRPIGIRDLDAGSVIGMPIPDLQIYILDAHREPVPIGVNGEIYVGGAGVARGYLNNPGLTAERFIPDPFSSGTNARLYKTGDRARRLANGDIEYLGRADDQVKIRGHRIELGEINSALTRHPAVRECAVLTREDSPGDKRLIAYVVAEPDKAAVPFSELRDFLKSKLPDYMVPSAFVALDRFPLTSNGKVDRKQLPKPEYGSSEVGTNYIAPNSQTEKIIAGVWGEALGLQRVGVNDTFFDLGGHSLLMVKVQAKLRDELKKNISIAEMFQFPTISLLSRHLDQDQAGDGEMQKVRDRARQQKQSFARPRRGKAE